MAMMRSRIGMLEGATRVRLMGTLSAREAQALQGDWAEWAHGGQRAPAGDDWRTWVMMAGRGYGKTRAGAQWIAGLVRAQEAGGVGAGGGAGVGAGEPLRIALVAGSIDEARRLMIEGPSGLLAIAGDGGQRPVYEASRRRLVWPGGSEATLFSGCNPEALRGPEHHLAWCDELAKWRHPEACWDMLQLGLRAGARPRALVTTTPRAGCAVLARILAAPDTARTGGASGGNPHLPGAWIDAMVRDYGATRLGRQEIDGELLEDLAGTLWPAALIEASRWDAAGVAERMVRVAIGVDPPASAAGICGIMACGVDAQGVGHVLADETVEGLSPENWARAVARAVARHGADRVIAEGNQGGEMVRAVLASAGVRLHVDMVNATRGKVARAEPVAALFEGGRVRLCGRFPRLEAQLGGLIAGGGYEGPGRSPDRADAMVWALYALMLKPGGEARIRLP